MCDFDLTADDEPCLNVAIHHSSIHSFAAMQGLSISSLRSIGASVRHASGVNTCARCLQHYFSGTDSPASGPDECSIHTRDLSSEGDHDDSRRIYPCCSAPAGSKGCTPAPHLPLYQSVDGKVDPQRRIEYDGSMDLKVGRWMSTKVKLAQLNQKMDNAPAHSSVSAAVPVPAASSASASPVVNPAPSSASAMGTPVPRVGDEIMVCGQLYHTGTPVILWSDVGGYDHYRVERRFCPFDEADWATTQKELPDAFTTPNRFGLRKNGLTPDEIERVRGGQWDLPTLTKQMKAFVLHYDEAGLSRECFKILQDERDLSIHFMCDLDGTIYQALDVKERAWQATIENTNSVGCEIANIGAYDPNGPSPFAEWYAKDAQGNTIITIPSIYPNNGGIHTPGFVGSPSRPNPIQGVIQGQNLIQYDYTPQQYAALSKLIATFCTIFPAVPLIYPMDAQGNLIRQKLPDAQLATYVGLLGHYHIQTDKIDPGPAMQWNVLISDAKMHLERAKRARAIEEQQRQTSVNEKAKEYNLLRKMERKLISQAEEAGALAAQPSDPFYLVSSEWWNSLQTWLHATDGVTPRPSAISNDLLLEGDNRTAKSGLSCPLHYTSVHEKLWKELVEMYGTRATIIRPTNDIYASRSKNGAVIASASASSSSASSVSSPALSAHHPPAYSSAPGAAALSQFVVPAIQPSDPDPWIVVTKRVMPSEPNAKK